MGAELTQHPETFRAVVSFVGIYDMLHVENTPNGAFNVTEYGTVKDPAQFQALYAYSPFHNVKDGTPYPSVLFLTGANDPRVDPYHSRKMTARLQAATSSGAPGAPPDERGHGTRDWVPARARRLTRTPTCTRSSSTSWASTTTRCSGETELNWPPMHVHLVAPSNEDSTYIKPLWVATLAAHTPDDVELTFRDDGLDPIDLDEGADAPDLVGISVELEDRGARLRHRRRLPRARARRVVLGGIHVTALPEEGLLHADAVVSGRGRVALAGRRARRARRQARHRRKLAPPRPDLQARRLQAPRRPAAAAARPRSVAPLRAVRRRADDARLPVPVRVLQRLDVQRDEVPLPPRAGGHRRARDVRPAHPLRRRQRDDPHEVQPRALRGDGAARQALGGAGLARGAPPRRQRRGDGARGVPARSSSASSRSTTRPSATRASARTSRASTRTSSAASPTTASPCGAASSSASTTTAATPSNARSSSAWRSKSRWPSSRS